MGKKKAAKLAEARVRQAQDDARREQEVLAQVQAQGPRTGLRSRSTAADFRNPVEAFLPAGYTYDANNRTPAIRSGTIQSSSYSQQNDLGDLYRPQSQYGGPQSMGGSQFYNPPPQPSNFPQYYNPPHVQPVTDTRFYNPSSSQPLQPPQSLNTYPQIPNQPQPYIPPRTRQSTQSYPNPQPTPQNYNQPPSQSFTQPPPPGHPQARSYIRPSSPFQRESSVSPPSSKKKLPSVPSKASGGIPEPTPEYIRISQLPTTRLEKAQHLLVIIDLNGTLLYRPNRKEPKKFVKRPHTDRFLNYCIDTFTVVIWSSAKPDNVQHMCANILTAEMAKKVAAIWGRDKFNLIPTDYNNKTQCYKRLTKIWADKKIAATHPEASWGTKWDQTNTVLIDDDNYKGKSEPFNLIEIPEFAGKLEDETGDILPQVHDYLNKLSLHNNVSSYLRANPWKAKDAADGPPSA